MTTKEMIEVMQAYEDGKTIEVFTSTHTWHDIIEPNWNWEYCKYRVKAEPKYRPFKDKDELLNYLHNHYNTHRNIWIKNKIDDSLSMIIEYGNKCVTFGIHTLKFSTVFENYTFEDGTPFGIKEN